MERLSLRDRLLLGSNVSKETGCWEWQGAKNYGYGVIGVGGFPRRTHRISYEEIIGPIPEGLTLDHLCKNRTCCNPWHLEPVTAGVNTLRGNAPSAINARKSHCKFGHPFDESNTYLQTRSPGRVRRHCKVCQLARHRKRVGYLGTEVNSKKTCCIHGHAFTTDNTVIFKVAGGRTKRGCRECRRIRDREAKRSRRVLAAGGSHAAV